MPETTSSSSPPVVYPVTVPSRTSDCMVNGSAVNPVHVACRLSASANGVSTVGDLSTYGDPLSGNVGVFSAHDVSVLAPGASVKCGGVVTTPRVQSESMNGSVSPRSDSRSSCGRCSAVSVDLGSRLPSGRSCHLHAGLESDVTPALLALVSKASSLKNHLPKTNNSMPCPLVPANSSTLQAPVTAVKTTAAMTVSTVSSSTVRPFASSCVVSAVCSSPLALISRCLGIATGSGNQPSHCPVLKLPATGPRRHSVLPCVSNKITGNSFAPILSTAQLSRPLFPYVGLPKSAASYELTGTSTPVLIPQVPTSGISSRVCSCVANSTRIFNRVCTYTVPAVGNLDAWCSPTVGISDQVRTRAVRSASVISGQVQISAVATSGISNQSCMCAVPAVGVPKPVFSSTATGISSPVCVRTVPFSENSDRVQIGSVPATAWTSDQIRARVVPSVTMSRPVSLHNVPAAVTKGYNMLESGNLTCSLSLSDRLQSSASKVRRTQRVLPPATGCGTRPTPIFSSVSAARSLSVCPPVSSTFHTSVKSVMPPEHLHGMTFTSAVSISDRHFLDSLVSPKPCLNFSSVQIPSSSSCSSDVTGSYIPRTSYKRNLVTGSCQMEAGSVPLSAANNFSLLAGILGQSAVDSSITGHVKSSTSSASYSSVVTHPMFVFLPQHRPLLERISLLLLSQKSSSKSPRKTGDTNSSGDFPHVSAASAVDRAVESVTMVASSPVDHRHHGDNGDNHQRTERDKSFPAAEAGVNEATESAGTSTVSHAHAGSTEIRCHSDREFSSLTATVATGNKPRPSVAMVTAPPFFPGYRENHKYGCRDKCSPTADTTVHGAREPAVMVTSSVADYHRHSNRKFMPSSANSTAAKNSLDPVAASAFVVDSHCCKNREMSSLAAETAVTVSERSVDTVTTSPTDDHLLSSREAFDIAKQGIIGSFQKKAKKMQKLCSQVSTILICVFC